MGNNTSPSLSFTISTQSRDHHHRSPYSPHPLTPATQAKQVINQTQFLGGRVGLKLSLMIIDFSPHKLFRTLPGNILFPSTFCSSSRASLAYEI